MQRLRATPQASGLGALLGVVLAGGVFAMLAGLGTALAGPMAAAMFSAIVLGITALFLPIRWLVVALVLLSFVITGQLIYFARIDKALWFPFLTGALLLVRFPLDRMQRGRIAGDTAVALPASSGAMRFFIVLYFCTLAASTAFNLIQPMQLLVSSKEYVFMWGLYLVLAAGLVRPELVSRVWALLPWLMLIQLPLIVYQRFVVAPSRQGIGAAWDAVVGVFGGNPQGGGSSGAMGLYCVVGMMTVLARWRRGVMPGWQALILAVSGLLGIALAEIKFAVLLIPVAFGLLFLREFARRPLRGLVAILVGFSLAFGVLVAYKAQYGRSDNGQTMGEYFEGMFSSSTDADFVNLKTREIGRVAAITFWASRHGIDDPLHLFVGHGAGASRIGDLVVGDAAKGYPFNIARSALAILLWEVGLIGALAYVGLLAATYLRLFRQSLDSRLDADVRATCGSMAVAVVMFAAGLPYNTDLLFSHQIQVLLMMCMGYAAMMNVRLGRGTGVPAQRAPRMAASA